MPKYLPKPLEPTLPLFDQIINQQAATLAQNADAKASVADLTRLYQLRLELSDRFEAANPRPVAAVWVNPAWATTEEGAKGALETLDRVREEFAQAARDEAEKEKPQ